MIKQQLSTRIQQKLSPLQIQQIKLLELNALEIENRIDRELEDNPALEEAACDPLVDIENNTPTESFESADTETDSPVDISLGDYLTEDDIPDYKLQQSYYSKENEKERTPYPETESFFDYLSSQLRLKELTDSEFNVAEYLIWNLDEDGYLRRNLDSLSDDLAFQYSMDVSVQEINKALELVRTLDPAGVGASDLRDCLLLQLERKEKTPPRIFAITILTDFFDFFSKKQYDKIIRNLDKSEQDLKDAIKEITALNPRPGGGWESAMETAGAQIIPDFYIETTNGELIFSMLEEKIPELRINKEYSDLLKNFSEGNASSNQLKKDALLFVKQKLDSAKWFIEAIKQRKSTLKKTMLVIMSIQRDFFLSGEESDLKPMILKDVAKLCSYDISTISRVSNSKYVQTNWGVFPLKYFFSEAAINNEGEEISTREIKAILRQCVDNENKKRPMTDDLLMKALMQKGYDIARRTVAKYREQLNIPVARLRKEV